MVVNSAMLPCMVNTYGYGYNNDFMSNACNQQALMCYKQPETDTYQSSGSTPKYLVAGAVAGGTGAYFFGDKLGINFIKDGKFSDDLLKAIEQDPVEIAKNNTLAKVATEKEAIATANGFANYKEYEAVRKYVSTPAADRAALSKELTDLVPDSVKRSPNAVKTRLFNAYTAIDNIDIEGISKQALADAKAGNFACQTEELANLVKRKSLIEGLAKDATPAQIEELITKNPKVFGIEKTVEAEIKAEANTIATRYANKAGALAEVTPLVTAQENLIKTTRSTLNSQVASHWDDAAKAFRADAPEALTKAAKNFKWAKTFKFALIGAGIGLVANWLFGK